ncbi:hypothetical protein EJ07DRAFT_172395 [Lizonia empirigonia]|nr:hypothetical protein EJ07DRAFT_172395 [Lizonia empirigonia]
MEPTQHPSGSNAQKDVGLSTPHYKRYLWITLAVAKSLVHKLAEQNPEHGEKLSWRDVTLVMEAEAIARVNTKLAQEGIDAVEEAKIRERLKKAIKDVQRSSKKISAEPTIASSSVLSHTDRPYDPIRDV